MNKKIIAGNWKLNPQTRDEARSIFLSARRVIENCTNVTAIVCPPALYIKELVQMAKGRKRIFVGAQNCFHEESGAYTGEISAGQIADLGANYIIVGHSERRAMGETDEVVNKKLKMVLRAGLIAIVCVGENERDDHGNYLSFLERQLEAVFSGVSAPDLKHLIIAYEPVWAIGKSEREAMKPHDLHEMALFIRKIIAKHYGTTLAFKFPILYGGSVEAGNVKEHLEAGVDGLLVGRASADAEKFTEIISAASLVK